MTRIERGAALLGASLVSVSLVIIWVARFEIPRDLYVSELGAAGMPTARAFMVALLFLVAGGSAIAWAARSVRATVPVLRLWRPAITLWVSCALFLLASQVTCTSGCPVPYGPEFTLPDFIHTTAALFAFAAAAWAMLQCSFAVGHPMLARFSFAAAISVASIAGVGGILSALDWNSAFGSRLEFVATTIGILWITILGVATGLGRSAPHDSAPHEFEQAVGKPDEAMDLVLVPIDPPALRLVGDRDEALVMLPDDERPLGAEHVLLPPHLSQVRPGDAAPGV